ncbi:CDP-glycerol--glycerophosphate glycerophosphotransferase [Ornithinibacillus gellani]|uniref:CDP-glycerol glycerophosphotransferase family protein n=1 Tax=Ornithinibacillus gellani TaxID=2293253 RepID=UPI000F4AC58F|nr:CDP-glycerol glycerophosphotransferase family protein [Ornithinibacillus gellani]TQS71160.1 CDP-glycerol--glycerophosphate glycerophosphotransferase [Ornithinibacillus gellani]
MASFVEQLGNRFCEFYGGQVHLQNGFCDFSGNTNLKGKKHNKKYYVYRNHGMEKVKAEDYNEMELIATEAFGNEQIIFYADANKNISFVRSKRHHFLSPMQIADKCEKHPMLRTFLLAMFSSLHVFGVLRFREYNFQDISVSVGYDKAKEYKVHFLFPKKIRSLLSYKTNKLLLLAHIYWVRIPLKDIYAHYEDVSEINNPMFVKLHNRELDYYYNFNGKSSDKYNKKHFIYNTLSTKIPNTEVEMYVRKSITGQFVIVVSTYLSKLIVFKEFLAYLVTRFKWNKDVYDIYFEKFSQGASESGFELFKHSITKNKNSIYILDRENDQFESLKKQYPKNLFAKNSFPAFYHIFLGRSFISSDLVTHIQRRLYDNDGLIKRKVLQNENKIFLQHGVSLATNVFERGYYNKKVPISPDYIIVNSQFEKDTFLKSTNYKEEELIVTGLPNLDLYVESRDKTKDEITFLLTWRPWDLTGHIEDGSYIYRYLQFIDLIRNNDFYADKKINIVLHPKAKIILQEQFPDFYHAYQQYFYEDDIKDALLKTKVLISDYSSVSFMSFSGGTNVVFYWEDKERAEKEYGTPNILQAHNAFGDMVYSFNELHQAIEQNYNRQQAKHHIEKFNQMVECTNGDNTENTFIEINTILE